MMNIRGFYMGDISAGNNESDLCIKA